MMSVMTTAAANQQRWRRRETRDLQVDERTKQINEPSRTSGAR